MLIKEVESRAANYWETEQYLLDTEYQLTKYHQTENIDKEFIAQNFSAFGKELLANVYAAEAKPDSLRQVVAAIQADTMQLVVERVNTVNYLNTVATVLEQQQNIYTANNNLVTNLPVIENNYTTKASVHASSALKARKQNHYTYTIAKFTDNVPSNARLTNLFTDNTADEKIAFANTRNFKIYPNPNNGSFKILYNVSDNNEKEITISITNIVGQTVYNNTIISETNSIELNNLSLNKGIYVVTLKQDKQAIGQSKLIIE